jgi:hypothetical protein
VKSIERMATIKMNKNPSADALNKSSSLENLKSSSSHASARSKIDHYTKPIDKSGFHTPGKISKPSSNVGKVLS